MDHLLVPTYPHIEIPYLCGNGFIYRQWKEQTLATSDTETEEMSHGSSIETEERLNEPSSEMEERPDEPGDGIRARDLQVELYFGMLYHFFETELETDPKGSIEKDFVRQNNSGQKIITTARLPDYLQRKLKNLEQSPEEDREKLHKNIDSLLGYCHADIHADLFSSENHSGDENYELVGLSILVLGSTLTYWHNTRFEDFKIHLDHKSWGPSEFLLRRLKDRGWCPSEVRAMSTHRFSTPSLYSFTFLNLRRDSRTHASCSTNLCSVLQIDHNNYETLHRDGCVGTGCKDIGPSEDQIASIISAGHYPLIHLGPLEGPINDHQLEVTASSTKTRYVAISHVWADGLGNLGGNTLPQCQLKYFRQLLDNLYPEVQSIAIWIDTLCVPSMKYVAELGWGRDKANPRALAIGRLAETYKKADKVLVLDKELQQSPWSSGIIAAMRISVCRWGQRLWTYQEAALANDPSTIAFRFLDESVSLSRLIEDQRPNLEDPGYVSLHADVFHHLLALRGKLNGNSYQKFGQIWNELQWRSTSRQEDEMICTAHLLGQPVANLLEALGEDRTKILIDMLDEFPTEILFMPGPRIAQDGYRWAPTSFLKRQQSIEKYEGVYADSINRVKQECHVLNPQRGPSKRVNKGLVVQLNGLLLTPTNNPYKLPEHFYIVDSAGVKCWHAGFLDSDVPNSSSNVAIVADRDLDLEEIRMAVLVSDCHQEDDTIYAKFLCRMWVAEPEKYEDLKKETHHPVAVKSSKHDKWCIG